MVTPPARKVMVVADPSPHSAAALQYALSHALLEQDELILLHVENTSSWKNTLTTFLKRPTIASAANAMTPNISSGPDWGSTDVNFLDQMKYASEIAQPKIPVRIEKIDPDGKDKATVILSKSKDLGIDLIIIGQKRSLSSAILGYKRPSGSMKGSKLIDTVDYLIENSPCTCVGVQKKGQNGGYVLNSKTQKNFWLLG
ncbi:Adenine nucleotide alpha hydrolases-like superfamily protein [Gossypium australe]|uniref:Adenine nucleotide alpha hydrolases-like superfamily protein n=1 Tax=Gossypium australe TaxID=47621 RepID=A0A5B6U8Z7_9ROSI|nr:Adenine nucleotide alpha hydrolases-like superfamily protein [Gossypium australe]